MYMSEISKFKISDLKAQKMIILWTMKHVSAIRKHPVYRDIVSWILSKDVVLAVQYQVYLVEQPWPTTRMVQFERKYHMTFQ